MKQTDFAISLQKFFSDYLVHQRGCSTNTIKSYRDTFKLFLEFLREQHSIKPEKMVLSRLTSEVVSDFCKYIEKTRCCTTRTRNQRLSVLHSFVKYLQYEHPERMQQWQKILGIPMRRQKTRELTYLSQHSMSVLFSVIFDTTQLGLRDRALLMLLYDTGARVQEIVDLSVRDISLVKPSQVTLHGKGGKLRVVPLMDITTNCIKKYMETFCLHQKGNENRALFSNRRGERMTRFGISFILEKYASQARLKDKSIVSPLTPHILRHSKAMHLLEAGCHEVVIQNFLGHSDIKTTGIYVKADTSMVRAALEKVTPVLPKKEDGFTWQKDKNLLDWLNDL
ncbi:MAG: tyrosine-type recombinase/integrase [Culicoidibacterales bacterium]